MKKITLAVAALAIALVFVGCGPKTEDAKDTGTTAGGNGKPDSAEPKTN
jgi:protein involved in sex pheromone biosynthesis